MQTAKKNQRRAKIKSQEEKVKSDLRDEKNQENKKGGKEENKKRANFRGERSLCQCGRVGTQQIFRLPITGLSHARVASSTCK